MKRLASASLVTLSMVLVAGCPYVTTPTTLHAHVQTSLGEFVVELDPERAPLTVLNFLQYVDDDFYDGTIFHRVVADFVVQGGGFAPDLAQTVTRSAIPNESSNGLLNLRGTVAMARTDDPNSATTQFFVNLADNTELDATADRPGYAVFGQVVQGMDVVDRVAAVPTEERGGFTDVPVEDVIIEDIELVTLADPGLELTPEGAVYLDVVEARALILAREVLVQLVDLLLLPG